MTSPSLEASPGPYHESSINTGILPMPRALPACALCANASSYPASPYGSVPAFQPCAVCGRNPHQLPVSLCHQHSRPLQDSMLSAIGRFDDLSSLALLSVSLGAFLSISQGHLRTKDPTLSEPPQLQ